MDTTTKRIAIIGSGSWATAIAKMLETKGVPFGWYFRTKKRTTKFKKHKHNPKYLSSIQFDVSKIEFYHKINTCVENADILIFAIPAAFIMNGLRKLEVDISEKIVVSAIKGMVPETSQILSSFFATNYNVKPTNFCVIKGPCHAEEIANERLSYLTIASKNLETAQTVANYISVHYVKTNVSNDVVGAEYAAVLKNIMAIASGIAYGLRYGDNFQAVLISNAIQEIKRFLDVIHPEERDVTDSVYLGDLLVTTYSQFSRNRTFGNMIGRGYTVRSTILELSMVAEGYYAVKSIYELAVKHNIDVPITKAVYYILYERIAPMIEMQLLSDELR